MSARRDTTSTTAAVVASTMLVLEHHPRLGSLVDAESSSLVRHALAAMYPAIAPIFARSRTRRILPLALAVERILSPGFITYYALRKTAVRAEISRAIDDGFRQIVLVGAGLDMLSVSLPKIEKLTIIEVDHPATERAKARALAGDARNTCVSIGVDLATTSLANALATLDAFDSTADTVFVAEGVFMYLRPARVDAIFEAMASATSGRVRSIFSVVAPDARGRLRIHSQSRAVDVCMSWLDETFDWGLAPKDVEHFLTTREWSLDTIQTTADLRGRFLDPIDAHRVPDTGEMIVTAQRAGLAPETD